MSVELAQDSRFPLEGLLAAAFGVFHARGISPDLITALLSDSTLGHTATGDQNSDTPSGKTQVGYQDLVALRTALDSAYRALGANWLMNDTTLGYLDGLVDKQGRPILHPKYDENGRRLLLGYPVGICPSLANIGTSNIPILFGCTSKYFAVRKVNSNFRLQILRERYMDYGVIGFRSVMRAQGQLQIPASPAPSPCVYLQNSAT